MNTDFLKSKIHRATVTESELHYEGSIGIDRDLMDAAGFSPYEKVDVLNINNGNRFSTYIIEYPRGNGDIVINGAAAHLASPDDLVIILSYCSLHSDEVANHKPTIVKVDEKNKVKNG